MLKRLIHLGKTLLLIVKLRRAKSDDTQHMAKIALADQLASGRGLPMKVGQIFAGMDDKHFFKDLTQSVAPWKLSEIKIVLEQTWKLPISNYLIDIKESQAAASLGQVHKAELVSGETVAIKVQYPDIQKAIQTELMLIHLIPKGGPVKRWDFDVSSYKETLKKNMDNELNYELEMHQQQLFAQLMHVKGLNVPAVYPELCRKNILVQDWVEGVRLSKVISTWDKLNRLQVAKILMQTMFQSIFKHGLVHGDPHPGNFLFEQGTTQPTVHLLDYGCMVKISEQRRLVLLQLILTCRQSLSVNPLEGFVALGFDAVKLQSIQAKLPALMQIIFRPFLIDKPFDLKHWHPSRETEALLGQQKWLFRAAGPADLFLLMRIFQGLALQLSSLQSQLPWWPILKQALSEDFITEVSHQKLVEEVVLPEFNGTAEYLKIEVFKDSSLDIDFSLPASNALDLESLIPEEAMSIILDQNIDITAVVKDLKNKGIHPAVLFDVSSGNKRYRVSLT